MVRGSPQHEDNTRNSIKKVENHCPGGRMRTERDLVIRLSDKHARPPDSVRFTGRLHCVIIHSLESLCADLAKAGR